MVKTQDWCTYCHFIKYETLSFDNYSFKSVFNSLSFLYHPPHQEACLQGNLIAICLEQLSDPHPLLRQWVAICLGRIWQNFDPARWCGVRDSAHEKLYTLLSDPIPEVRAGFTPESRYIWGKVRGE